MVQHAGDGGSGIIRKKTTVGDAKNFHRESTVNETGDKKESAKPKKMNKSRQNVQKIAAETNNYSNEISLQTKI